MPKSELPEFQTAFATYKAIEIIGAGGAGRVYSVTDETGAPFAVKLLDPAQARGEKLKRFKNELSFCLQKKHRNILTVLDHGVYLEGTVRSPFYVMPLFDSSLRPLLQEGINPGKIMPYFGQILDGAEAAHLSNVIHRDLKPENILFDKGKDTLVIADFGIARFQEDQLITAVETKDGDRLANFQYAAPEQRVRGGVVDKRADIFALALILNELFTGQVPHGTGYRQISSVSGAYPYLDEIVSWMMRQEPADRPSSVDLIKQQLIVKGNEFISMQRLSELRQEVIPVGEIDDPLVRDPVRVVNFDYNQGELTLILNHAINEKWNWALHNMGSHSWIAGYAPHNFHLSGNKAFIRVEEHYVQKAIDLFKSWLPRATQVYTERLKREELERESQLRAELQKKIQEEERRERILKNVRI